MASAVKYKKYIFLVLVGQQGERSCSLFIRVIEGHWWIHIDRAGAKWRGHKAIHDRGDINANCAEKIREIPLVLLLVIWPVDEALVEIVDAHVLMAVYRRITATDTMAFAVICAVVAHCLPLFLP